MQKQKGNTLLVILLVILILLILGGGGYWIYKITKENKELKSTTTDTTKDLEKKDLGVKPNSPSEDESGPYYHQVYSAISSDGITWEKLGNLLFDHASVPGAVIKDGVVYIYFVDAAEEEYQLSVGISEDLGKTFTKHKVSIDGEKYDNAADPHPELINGKITLFYLGNFTNLPSQGENAKFIMYRAQSSDGINFENRALAYEGENMNTDPDVFQTSSDWRMLVSFGKNLILATAPDENSEFSKVDDFSWSRGGVPDTINIGDNYYTYYCGDGGIGIATGADTGKLIYSNKTAISVDDGQTVCDPSVIQLPDESYLMFYKTQDTPKQEQIPQNNTVPGQQDNSQTPQNIPPSIPNAQSR